jgi:hypothetical protein
MSKNPAILSISHKLKQLSIYKNNIFLVLWPKCKLISAPLCANTDTEVKAIPVTGHAGP